MQHPFLADEQIKKQSFNSHQLAMNDYLLILQPHEDLYQTIIGIKQSFAKAYDCPMAAYLKPHLTLVRFAQYEMLEQRLLQQLQAITTTNAPFKVELDGFNSIPTHTICIHVKTKNQIIHLIKEIRQAQHLMKPDKEHTPHFITDPHIPIARKLLPWQYEKGWLENSNTPFHASFMANEVLLLKRMQHAKGYTVMARFPLHNQPVVKATQAVLFGS